MASSADAKRREHVNRVLSAKKDEQIRNRWNQDPEFLCVPPFQNSLPMVPMGPYFKMSSSVRPFNEFATYKMTSLERNYVWQPHYGPDLNIKLDLVDQDSILVSDKTSTLPGSLASETRGVSVGLDRPRPSRGANHHGKKYSWLKNTIYLTNDLGESVKRRKEEKSLSEESKTPSTDELESNLFSADFINKSFEVIEFQTKTSLLKKRQREMQDEREREKEKKPTTVEWIMPIIPDAILWRHDLTFLQFDENPEESFTSETAATPTTTTPTPTPTTPITPAVPTPSTPIPTTPTSPTTLTTDLDTEISASEPTSRTPSQSVSHSSAMRVNRVLHGLLTNIRPFVSDVTAGNTDYIATSLIAPEIERINETKTSLISGSSTVSDEVEYQWLRDYSTYIRASSGHMDGSFLFQVDTNSNQALYCPFSTRLEMRRMKIQDSDEHTATVRRYEEEE